MKVFLRYFSFLMFFIRSFSGHGNALPDQVSTNLIITDLLIFNKSLTSDIINDSVFKVPIAPILLSNQNHLTFKLGFEYIKNTNLRFQYFLEGYEKDWSPLSYNDHITYHSLPPGRYNFKARAISADLDNFTEEVGYTFTITNPFYNTWWFYGSCFLFSFLTLGFVLRYQNINQKKQKAYILEERTKLLAEIKIRKKAERKQKLIEEKLKQSNNELNTFIYKSSHDLRGPLLTVKGLTQLGLLEGKDESSIKYFHLISDRVKRLDMILKNLMQIVEITDDNILVQLVDFEKLISSALKGIQNEHIKKNISIEKEINLEKDFFSDKKLLLIIFKNILENSIQYSDPEKPESWIKIKVRSYGNGVIINIRDNGYGIAPDVKEKVFQMFFKGNNLSKGSGLGLYVAQKIIFKLDGYMRLQSSFNEFTSLSIYLPSREAVI